METELYHYKAIVRKVYDGDTCTVDIDLGLGAWMHGEKIRLYGINAPEVRGIERPIGLVSRDFLRSQIKGKEIILQSIKDKKGKYGRYLGEIWLKGKDDNGEDEWININALMVNQGYAVYKEY